MNFYKEITLAISQNEYKFHIIEKNIYMYMCMYVMYKIYFTFRSPRALSRVRCALQVGSGRCALQVGSH